MTARRKLSPLLAIAALVSLSGCVGVGPSPSDPGPTVDRPSVESPETSGDCVALAEPGLQRFQDCDELIIEGNDLTVEARAVGVITVRGDRIDVDIDDAGALSIAGNDNEVDIDRDLGTLEVFGDRNDVEVDGEIGTVRIEGNDNEVSAADIGGVTESGDRNRMGR